MVSRKYTNFFSFCPVIVRQGTNASQTSSVKMPVNKATVDSTKEIKINNNHKSFPRFTMKKRALLFFVKFLVNN